MSTDETQVETSSVDLSAMSAAEILEHSQGITVAVQSIEDKTQRITLSKKSADSKIQELQTENQNLINEQEALKKAYIALFNKFQTSEANNRAMSEQIQQTAETVSTTEVPDSSIKAQDSDQESNAPEQKTFEG